MDQISVIPYAIFPISFRRVSFLAHTCTKTASAIKNGPATTAASGTLVSKRSRPRRPFAKSTESSKMATAATAMVTRVLLARTHMRRRTLIPRNERTLEPKCGLRSNCHCNLTPRRAPMSPSRRSFRREKHYSPRRARHHPLLQSLRPRQAL